MLENVITHKRNDFCCHEISQDDIKVIRNKFFKTTNKNAQDNKLGHFMSVNKPARRRNRKLAGKSHNFTIKYHVSIIFIQFYSASHSDCLSIYLIYQLLPTLCKVILNLLFLGLEEPEKNLHLSEVILGNI